MDAAFWITWIATLIAILLAGFIDMRRRMRVRLGELPESTPQLVSVFPSRIDLFYIFSSDFAKVDSLSPRLVWPLRLAIGVAGLGWATMIGSGVWAYLNSPP